MMSICRIVEKLVELISTKKNKSFMLESYQVKHMKEINKQARDQDNINLKYQVLDGFEEALGDKWYRLKDETRYVLDEVAFLGKDAGFIYARPCHFEDTCNVSERTFRNNMSELEQLGKVVKLHQRSSKCNGRGTPIYLLVDHPLFAYWIDCLGLEEKIEQMFLNFQTEFQTEEAGKPCESKRQGSQKVSTYALPSFHESNLNITDYQEWLLNIKKTSNVEKIRMILNLKIDDIEKRGILVKHPSSFLEFILKSVEKQVYGLERMKYWKEQSEKQKREEEQRKIELYGTVQGRRSLPFYNWLES